MVPRVRVLNRWQPHANTLIEEREDAARRELDQALRQIEGGETIALHVESGHVAERVAKAVAASPGRHPILVIGRRPKATGATAYRILSLAKAPVLQYADAAD